MKFIKILMLLGLLGFVVPGAIASSPARAGLLGDLFAKKQIDTDPCDKYRAIYPIQCEEDFGDVAKSYHGTPYNDPELEYEILVPENWDYKVAQIHDLNGPNRELVSNIASWESPYINTMQAVVTLQSIKLDREISAENWLKDYILANNYSLQDAVVPICADKTIIPCYNEKKAGASYVTMVDGVSSYFYVTIQINGNNAVIVQFESPVELKDAMAFVRKRIVDSFRFLLETDRPIETQKSFNFVDALEFRYPESLDVRNVDVRDTRHMSMQLFNMKKQGLANENPAGYVPELNGLIRLVVVKRAASTSLAKETDDIRNFVEGSLGLEFEKLVSSVKAPVAQRFLFSRYEVYQVAPKKGNALSQELRFVALGDKHWYVFALLLSPSDSEDFNAWANNVMDFDMIVKSFR